MPCVQLWPQGVASEVPASTNLCRCLFEDGQRLAALSDVQQLESELERGGAAAGRACRARPPSALPISFSCVQRHSPTQAACRTPAADAFPLAEVVAAAGAACKSGQLEGERDDQTICWSTPTASLTALFAALAEYATSCGREPGRAAAGHHAVHQLSRALVAALGGMRQQRMQQAQYFPAALNAAVAGVDEPELAAGADVRIALGAMADACCR